MKLAYPIILTAVSDNGFSGYDVYIPDLDINTQGESVADSISMARDAIGMWACFEIDEGRNIPNPVIGEPINLPTGSMMALVDIDIDAYRRAHDNRTVRKNLTIPKWLNDQAENTGVNFSQVLQNGLKQQLGVDEPDFIVNRYRESRSGGKKIISTPVVSTAAKIHSNSHGKVTKTVAAKKKK
ncbi:MAG: type II toxin-antitoxin system HicB family antitoxin [Syntrophomonadaceae bacterium]|nr:type II toxin-antitoxin system HicB family antitoxin [Syntrophomonadaceae bacterium]MDD3024841.1 type II toxin-antitoxin system HicB family antitoxin [Syntrophomonadaceae bacterium]